MKVELSRFPPSVGVADGSDCQVLVESICAAVPAPAQAGRIELPPMSIGLSPVKIAVMRASGSQLLVRYTNCTRTTSEADSFRL